MQTSNMLHRVVVVIDITLHKRACTAMPSLDHIPVSALVWADIERSMESECYREQYGTCREEIIIQTQYRCLAVG